MKKHRSPEYKRYLSKLVVEEGRKTTELSYETGVPVSTIRRWAATYRKELKSQYKEEGLETFSDMEKKLREAERVMKDLQEENEILKKAMHVFAKDQA